VKYTRGRAADSVLAPDGSESIALGSNENVLGAGALARRAIVDELGRIARYPGAERDDLVSKLAESAGVEPSNVVLGAGSSAVQLAMCEAWFADGDARAASIVPSLTFAMYALGTEEFGGRNVSVAVTPDLALDVDAMIGAVDADTRVLWLCSPNNPTGLTLSSETVVAALDRVPERVLVVLDEAYVEFVSDDSASDVAALVQRPNILVTRTFSKLHGLAGLRIGYAYAHRDVVSRVASVQAPFDVSRLALVAARAAMDDADHIAASIELVAAGRTELSRGLAGLGWRVIDSEANFVLAIDVPDVDRIDQRLLAEGVIVRPTEEPFGLPRGVRITIGRPDDNAALLDHLRSAVAAG
jgi:histidinol-phosphate aminotransferase